MLPDVVRARWHSIYRPPRFGGSEDGYLVFVCPNSGREVFTGLEIDSASFQGLSKVLAEINCSDCGGTHNLFEVQSRLVDDISNPPEGSNHSLPGTPDPIAG
jgi:hypothetical protein